MQILDGIALQLYADISHFSSNVSLLKRTVTYSQQNAADKLTPHAKDAPLTPTKTSIVIRSGLKKGHILQDPTYTMRIAEQGLVK
jgi:hypothetical protein